MHRIHVSLEDLYKGKTTKLALTRNVLCPKCDGRGGKEGAVKQCTTCHGRGVRIQLRQMGPMIQQMQMACEDCSGLGEIINRKDQCKNCSGRKTVSEKKFLEVHIDQSRELQEAGAAIGIVSALAGRMRVAVEIDGEADHAGTTRRGERRDAMAAAARLIVAAEDLADDERFVVTPTRLLVEPNALSTISGSVRLWLDARAPDVAAVDAAGREGPLGVSEGGRGRQ